MGVENRPTFYVVTPNSGDDAWFGSRAEAELYALDWMEGFLKDWGEGHESPCYVLEVVSETREVVGARRGDGSERGEWLEEQSLDYEILGYSLCRHFSVDVSCDERGIPAPNRVTGRESAAQEAWDRQAELLDGADLSTDAEVFRA